ncbi:putative phospholipase/carboxylesterase [Sphaerosporella brunnea]|uniref:Putative phospholipase/carboxylesterase n=1 Tax=Sphaerosporella brunnea TaxID=1250544 RepID=A0A5J5ER99_9PEZI|nr:putative phospholipase/carboxylesterase [Sphaerosporella brunnea]
MTSHRPVPAFLEPLIIPPRGEHAYTLIFLHGRGDRASIFGPAFTADLTRSRRYASLKLVFPTPAPTFSALFYRHIAQWFDFNAGTEPKSYTPEQLDGLREVVEHVHALVDAEVAAGVAEERILLGGLSQGCAVALMALLLGGRRLGGMMGMSGWLPFAGEIRRALAGKGMPVGALVNGARDVDVPAWDEDEAVKLRERTGIIGRLRERIMRQPPFPEEVIAQVLSTPTWLGHGDADEVVKYLVGREIYGGLKALGMEVVWKRYRDFPHWYKVPEEIDDLAAFWEEKCGLSPSPSPSSSSDTERCS